MSALNAAAQLGSGTVYIDPVNGVDSSEQSGSAVAPLKSITYAMAQLDDLGVDQPWTLHLKPGEYKAPVETFPIALHTGMQLLGEGDNVIISGVDNPNRNDALVFGNGATNVSISGIAFQEQDRTGGTNQGGALELSGVSGQISNCQFVGNSTRKSGGAIWASLAEGGSLPLSGVTFTGNAADQEVDSLIGGGAVYIADDYRGDITGCTFTDNKTRNYRTSSDGSVRAAGGAIYVAGAFLSGVFSDTDFFNNEAIPFYNTDSDYSVSSGGAVHIQGNAETSFSECIFSGNGAYGYTSTGGAVTIGGYFKAPEGEGIRECTFGNNTARRAGGAVYIGQYIEADIDADFELNQAFGDISDGVIGGGALFVSGNFAGSISSSLFSDNLARNQRTSDDGSLRAAGGAVYIGGSFLSGVFNDADFINNEAIPFYNVDSYYSVSSGGAVHIQGNAETLFSECDFTGNGAYGYTSTGGAVTIGGFFKAPEGEGIRECTFNANTARRAGGAVYIGQYVEADFDANFESNQTFGDISDGVIGGGALFVSGDFTGNISSSLFSDNLARNQRTSNDGSPRAAGGAVYIGGSFLSGVFNDADFINNEAIPFYDVDSYYSISSGGAIHIQGDATTSFESCEFLNNAAYGYYATGGAVTIGGDFQALEDDGLLECLFADNLARGQGGALFAAKAWTGSVRGSDFIRNAGLGSWLEDSGSSLGGAFAVSGGMDGDIAHNLFSDNAMLAYESNVKCIGGAVGIGGTYQGAMEFNTFTANSSNGGRNVGSGGGAVAILGFAQQGSLLHSNLFSGNSAFQGGAVYFGASGGVKPRLFNNHLMYNHTPDNFAGGAAVFTRQNVLFYNNFVLGQAENAVGIAIQTEAVGTEVWNSIFLRVHTGIHYTSASTENNIHIMHNNFFSFTDAVRLGNEGLGSDFDAVFEAFDGRIAGNHTQSPLYYKEGDDDTPLQTGHWSPAAVYDPERDVTVFTDPLQSWTEGMWKNCMLNLSQESNNFNLRQQYLIVDNTRTQLLVRGNLVPDWEGIPSELNRGQLNTGYKIDNYHLLPHSYNLDRGAPVVVLVGSVETDITPTVDFEGDIRPINCGVDIGPDEALRSIPASLTLLGETEMCIQLGSSFVDPGFSALSETGGDLSGLVTLSGDVVNTSAVGTYRITYTLDLCSGEEFERERLIEVSAEPCEGGTGPVADAGPNQTLTAGPGGSVEVQLDGSASTGNELRYTWVGLEGAPDPADVSSPSFVLEVGTYTFRLIVNDDLDRSAADDVEITVRDATETGPIADAGSPESFIVAAGGTVDVQLDGSASSGTGLRFTWIGLDGAPDPADTSNPTVPLGEGDYTFQLTVEDANGDTDMDMVTVSVREVNGSVPVAIVERRVVRSLDRAARLPMIELDGSGSTDEDGTITSYLWSGLNGAPDPEDIARPILGLEPGSHTFILTVTDNDGLTDSAQLVVDVVRPPLEEVRTLFRDELAGADTNGNGQVSQSEAQAFVTFLTEEEFQELDRGSDGVLTADELDQEPGTTGCSPGRGGRRDLAGDFLLLVGVLGVLAYSALRRGIRRDVVLP